MFVENRYFGLCCRLCVCVVKKCCFPGHRHYAVCWLLLSSRFGVRSIPVFPVQEFASGRAGALTSRRATKEIIATISLSLQLAYSILTNIEDACLKNNASFTFV